jgi:hypothetical protein
MNDSGSRKRILAHPAEAASKESFWDKVNLLGDCWEWQGARTKFGHGKVRYGGNYFGAHVCAYEFSHGRLTKGLWVLHRCDNPPCVNPSHLYAGTPKNNTADMFRRGRAARDGALGSANPHSVLTETQVLQIRESFAAGRRTPKELAEDWQVTPGAINDLLRGKTWRHVGGPLAEGDRRGKHGNHFHGTSDSRA